MNNKNDSAILSGQEYHLDTAYDRLNMPRHALDWPTCPASDQIIPAAPHDGT